MAVCALGAVVRPVAVAAVAGLVAPHAPERALRVHAELVPRARSEGDRGFGGILNSYSR